MVGLTGQRFLGEYRDDEVQYRALMNIGATVVQVHQVRPCNGLSAEQASQLISDIVWRNSQVQAGGHLGFVGQWATLEPVPDQAFARNALAISTAFKGDVGFVVELEIVKPTAAQVGLVGPLGAAPGGALQVRFAFEQRQGAAHFRLLSRRALP